MRPDRSGAGALLKSGCLLALVAASVGQAQAANPVHASIAQGEVGGAAVEGVEYFMGIPYAAPPVGDLRWREPRTPVHWSGVRDATKAGAICPQPARGEAASAATSEDCLFVNVWRPAGAKPGARLPVMVWYHGGGMVFGSGSATDGRYLARKGVILVTLNYRLGHLGVFAHPALSAENPDGLTGNFTLMDAVAALKWVRANVADFGGDPGNVTIFGFSAGAQIVNTLMVTPSAKGFFAKAITQSGLGRNYGLEGQNRMLPLRGRATLTGEKAGLALAEQMGVKGTGPEALKALRAIAPEKFKIAVTSLPGSMIDGTLLPETIASAYRAGREAPVPQLIGRTKCERCNVAPLLERPETSFMRTGPLRDRAVALYGGDDGKAALQLASDLDHTEPARYLSRYHARNGRNTWSYVFDYTPKAKRGEMSGPAHGDDIPYIFGTLQSPTGRRFEPTDSDMQVSDAMMTYWTNFAKRSDPGSAGGVRWPQFQPGHDEKTLVFTSDGPIVETGFNKDRLDLAEQVNESFQAQSYIPD